MIESSLFFSARGCQYNDEALLSRRRDRSDYLPAHQMTRDKLQVAASGRCDQSEESSGSDAPRPVSDRTRSKMIKSHVASRQGVTGSSYGRQAASSVGGGAGDIPAT